MPRCVFERIDHAIKHWAWTVYQCCSRSWLCQPAELLVVCTWQLVTLGMQLWAVDRDAQTARNSVLFISACSAAGKSSWGENKIEAEKQRYAQQTNSFANRRRLPSVIGVLMADEDVEYCGWTALTSCILARDVTGRLLRVICTRLCLQKNKKTFIWKVDFCEILMVLHALRSHEFNNLQTTQHWLTKKRQS